MRKNAVVIIRLACLMTLCAFLAGCSTQYRAQQALNEGDTGTYCRLSESQSDTEEGAYGLARCYLESLDGRPRSKNEGVYWLRQSAEAGSDRAARKLQSMDERIPLGYFEMKKAQRRQNQYLQQWNDPFFYGGWGRYRPFWGGAYYGYGGCW